jgi:DNA-binding SARP family transcriptional activator
MQDDVQTMPAARHGDLPPNSRHHVPQRPLAAAHPLAPAAAAGAQTGTALTVRMLDGFRVWVGVEPLAELPHGRARALLKLLLLQRRRPLSRSKLCTLFWPEAEPGSARNSLNVTLHRLRRALGKAGCVRHADEGYQLLAPGEVWLDAEQFVLHAEMGRAEEAAGRPANAIGQYEAALALYHSDLLDEGDAEMATAALAPDAQALRDHLSEVLERLAALHQQAGEWHGCLRTTLRHLGLDQCNEGAHRRLMHCYAQLGQLQLAERQYRACVGQLRLQLGAAPSSETTALYRRITAGVPA